MGNFNFGCLNDWFSALFTLCICMSKRASLNSRPRNFLIISSLGEKWRESKNKEELREIEAKVSVISQVQSSFSIWNRKLLMLYNLEWNESHGCVCWRLGMIILSFVYFESNSSDLVRASSCLFTYQISIHAYAMFLYIYGMCM